VTLKRVHHLAIYIAIKALHREHTDYPISTLCRMGKVNKAAYYKWNSHKNSPNDDLNEKIASLIDIIHEKHPDMGYRRLRDVLEHDHAIDINDKRMLRICRNKGIRSVLKGRYNCCTKPAVDPACVSANILNRDFHADRLNEKWVTDVTEFKYETSMDHTHKLYLSVILDLCDHCPVTYVLSDHNDNEIVFDTFDAAIAANPNAHPLCHSDRGYQYTSKTFHQKLIDADMTQSMSRVAHCTDNGPMEGFWGIMKREMYYRKKFHSKDELVLAISEYLNYYINERPQRKLGILTPMEYHKKMLLAA
jgi:transposase InsO family protein